MAIMVMTATSTVEQDTGMIMGRSLAPETQWEQAFTWVGKKSSSRKAAGDCVLPKRRVV